MGLQFICNMVSSRDFLKAFAGGGLQDKDGTDERDKYGAQKPLQKVKIPV